MNEMQEVYTALVKPSFAPPPELFGLIWGILYVLLFIASVLLIVRSVQARLPGWLVGLLFVNLVANLLFTSLFIQFGLVAGFLDITVVLATALWLQRETYRREWWVFGLLLPYTVWVGFASVLQASLLILN